MNDISNNSDYLDVRDIIARVEELRKLREPGPVEMNDPEDQECAQDDLFAELATLESLLDDMRGYGGDEQWEGDWYPVTLIRDSYFENAMDELIADCYELDTLNVPSFVTLTIDYDKLLMDYTSVEFDGVTYWYR